jgi:hypothetical protein
MTLIDSYIHSVRRLLPRETRDDVAAELRDALLTQIEAEQEGRGRALTEEEVARLISRFGEPRAVASRYGAPNHVIGPKVYPLFLVAAKGVGVLIGVIALVRIVVVAFSADAPLTAIGGVVGRASLSALVLLAIVTVICARLERLPIPWPRGEAWTPTLPSAHGHVQPPRSARRVVPRRETLTSLAMLTFGLMWWTNAVPLADWMLWRWLPIAPARLLIDLTPFAIGILLAGMAADAVALLQPRLVRTHEAAYVTIACGLLGFIGVALFGGPLVVATRSGASAESAASVTNTVFAWGLAGLALLSIFYVWFIVQGWVRATPGHGSPRAAPTS